MEHEMDLTRFERLADLHGGDLASWPDEARAPAAALLAVSAEAREALATAAALDEALADLAAAPEPPVSDALMARLMADAEAAQTERVPAPAPAAAAATSPFDRPRRAPRGGIAELVGALRGWFGPGFAAAAAASAAFGLALGWGAPDAMLAAVYPQAGYEQTAEAFLSAELLPAESYYPTEAQP